MPARRELDGVPDEVHEDLAESDHVAQHERRQPAFDRGGKPHALADLRSQGSNHVVE